MDVININKAVLNPSEAAVTLGCSAGKIYRLVKAGKLEFFRNRKYIMIPAYTIEDYIKLRVDGKL